MAALFQPPPTYALPIIVDEKTKQATFSPIWLKWFLDLVGVINASGGGGGAISHNLTTGLQGGTANQFYHLTQNQNTKVIAWASSGSTDLLLPAGVAGVSPMRIPHGAAPTSPVNGDVWTTTAGIFVRVNGVTVGPLT